MKIIQILRKKVNGTITPEEKERLENLQPGDFDELLTALFDSREDFIKGLMIYIEAEAMSQKLKAQFFNKYFPAK